MSKIDDYRLILRELDTWDSFLLEHSNLPGPRANLELAFAAALEGDQEHFLRYAKMDKNEAPPNSRGIFLAVCGVVGLGYLIARGGPCYKSMIRERASDSRWRIREAVALGLQRYGMVNMDGLLQIMEQWSYGSLYEQRAAIVTLCEPKLISDRSVCRCVLKLLDRITKSILRENDKRSDGFRVLKKSLGYCWSVAVAAYPERGKTMMENWLKEEDRDIRWIMRQNLKKKRLERTDKKWVFH